MNGKFGDSSFLNLPHPHRDSSFLPIKQDKVKHDEIYELDPMLDIQSYSSSLIKLKSKEHEQSDDLRQRLRGINEASISSPRVYIPDYQPPAAKIQKRIHNDLRGQKEIEDSLDEEIHLFPHQADVGTYSPVPLSRTTVIMPKQPAITHVDSEIDGVSYRDDRSFTRHDLDLNELIQKKQEAKKLGVFEDFMDEKSYGVGETI